jgi:hypothetical protein
MLCEMDVNIYYNLQAYNLPMVVYGCETGFLTLGKELRLRMFENGAEVASRRCQLRRVS